MKNKVILYNAFILLILLFALEVTFRILGFGYENAPLENDDYLHHKNPINYSFKCYTPSKEYGGHNLIEAAKNKCAIIVGPYMKNFEDILNLFKNENACVQIESKSELTNAYKELLNNNELRINMIDNATEVVANNRGSSDKQFKYINDLINYEISNRNN